MTTSKPGYGAIPPANLNASWVGNNINIAPQHAIQIGNPDPTITFHNDGTIVTRSGTITSEEWISVIKVMKQLIIDMSKDQELASKYPYIQDAAHTWMMNKLKGE